MKEIIVKQNELFGEVRFTEIDGKPYAIANDILKVLGYSQGSWRTTLKRKCKNVTKCNELKINGKEINLIPEGDIYRLIVGSKLPEALKFEKWVMEEVLPQIRQTGGYIPIKEEESKEEFLARAYLIAQETLKEKEVLLEQANEKIKENAPKVEYHDKVLTVKRFLTTTQIAKDLGMSSRELNTILKEEKILFKRGTSWLPYSKYQYLVPEYADYNITIFGQHLVWTEKGRKFIIELLEKKRKKKKNK